jgi:syntaxin 5
MLFLDRTNELTSIIDSKIQQRGVEGKKQKKKRKQNEERIMAMKQFYEEASRVSRDLQHSSELLQKLTKLVKKRTPFDENVEQIQQLTRLVKEQLATHEFAMKELREKIRMQQNNKKQSVDQPVEHSSHIVTGLDSRLMYVTKQFQSILEMRSKQIKQQQERRNMYTYNKSNFNRHLSQQSLPNNGNGELTINIHDASNGNSLTGSDGPMQQQAQQDLAISVYSNDQYLRTRSEEIKSIERDMRQLSDMFKDLGVMVKMQGELAARIDDNVTESMAHIEEGQNELLKYMRRVTSNRGLILKMFFVMIVFIIFIGVFVIS